MIFGILGSHTYGFENYTKGEAPFVGGLSGFLGVLLVAGFSVGGTEVVAVTGANLIIQKTMPKAVKQVFGEFYYSMYYQLVLLQLSFLIQIHYY